MLSYFDFITADKPDFAIEKKDISHFCVREKYTMRSIPLTKLPTSGRTGSFKEVL